MDKSEIYADNGRVLKLITEQPKKGMLAPVIGFSPTKLVKKIFPNLFKR